MPVWNFVWRSAYHDSVTLMRLAQDMEAVPGVQRAAAMMGTPANRALLESAGLLTDAGPATAPADLLIAVAASDEATARAAEAAARAALLARAPATRPGLLGAQRHRSRTLASALRTFNDASLALISVPGLYAAAEARKALQSGLHVMLFSDHVSVEAEIELKRLALSRGLFLMGPDCGTALINGVPLGFANAVPRGRIGVAAAAGTGLQEVSTLVARHGEGISHGIGVGGRDLSDAVGGLMMSRALTALAEDAATQVICVVGKPPGAAVAARLAAEIERLGKPCVVHYVGPGSHGSLEDCARAATALARKERPFTTEFTLPAADVERLVTEARRGLGAGPRFVRGIYAGGTLAWEALALLANALGDVAPDVTSGAGAHRVVDLGDDRFTLSRPHPMIDGTVRREWIAREAADPATAVLLLDVILGFGAHPDPAGELVPALARARAEARARGRGLVIVASVVGTDADPQGRARQVATLEAQGVIVMPSNAQAARLAARIARTASG
jgi:FdrA protein